MELLRKCDEADERSVGEPDRNLVWYHQPEAFEKG